MIQMRRIYALAPALLVAMAACGGETPQPAAPAAAPPMAVQPSTPPAAPPAPTPSESDVASAGPTPLDEDDESTTDLKEHHRHHHHGGFAMFIAMSLDSLSVDPDQSAEIVKIQTEMRAKMQPAHDAEKKLLTVLADGIASGKIDNGKVQSATKQVSEAAAGVHDAVTDSLNHLHAVLTPPQRAALVDKVEAHFAVWTQANSEDESAERDAHGGHLGALAKDLELSPLQVEKIRANFKASTAAAPVHFNRIQSEEHLRAFGEAFASDNFDAKTLSTGGAANAQIATWGATRTARFYEAVNPSLTLDQRTKLASSLRRHANYKSTETGT
jgi:Spy/CpxP family protein refolding chaperone